MRNYILAGMLISVIIASIGILIIGVASFFEYTHNSGYTDNSGYVTTNKTGELSSFNQIIVYGTAGCDLRITQGDTESLLVETEQNETSKVKVRVINNTLYLNSTTIALYHLTVKDINSIKMTGSGPTMGATNLKLDDLTISMDNGELNPMDNLTINSLTINLTGNAPYINAITNLNAKNLNINLNNSGKLFVNGKVAVQTISISGSGNYTATNLTSKTANIYVNGQGYAVVRVSDILNVIIKGDVKIHYIGNPRITHQINGSGTIALFPLKKGEYINS